MRLVEFRFLPHVDVRVEELLVPVPRGGGYWGLPGEFVRGWVHTTGGTIVDRWRVRATTSVRRSCGCCA